MTNIMLILVLANSMQIENKKIYFNVNVTLMNERI